MPQRAGIQYSPERRDVARRPPGCRGHRIARARRAMHGFQRHDHQDHRHHPERRDRPHLLDAARQERTVADPRRGRAHRGRRPDRSAPPAGRSRCGSRRRHRATERHRRLDHQSRHGAGRRDLRDFLRCRRDAPARSRPDEGDRGRQAHLHREAGGAVGRRGAAASPCRRGARHQAWRRGGQGLSAGSAQADAACARRVLRTHRQLPPGIRLVGVRRRRGPVPAPELELSPSGRRRAHLRHGAALALRDRGHPRADPPHRCVGIDRDAGTDR